MVRNKRILLTGGAGFIGSVLCRKLAAANRLTVLDTFSRDALSRTPVARHRNLTMVRGDVLDPQTVAECVRGQDIVIHLAAVAGIDTVKKDTVRTMQINLIGTYNVLEQTRQHNPRLEKVICFSTSEVFGTHVYKAEERNATTLGAVGEGRWTYAVSKLAGEHFAYSYYKTHGLPTVTVRPFNIYGPGQVGEGAIHIFIDRAIRNQAIRIHGDGTQIRSWCYVDDMLNAMMLILENRRAVGHAFNIGNPQGTVTIEHLAEKVVRLAGSRSRITHINKGYADVELRIPSISKAQEILGYSPRVSLDDGLTRTIAWYRRAQRRKA